jgi:hypothetical protein
MSAIGPRRSRAPLWGWLERLGKVLVVLLPAAYMLGRNYETAYWHALGLGDGLMDRSLESLVYRGFDVVWYTAAAALKLVPDTGLSLGWPMLLGAAPLGVVLGVGIFICVGWLVRVRRQPWLRRQRARLRMARRRLRRAARGERWLSRRERGRTMAIIDVLDRGTRWLLLLLVGWLVLIVAPLWGHVAGTHSAQQTDQHYRLWSAPDNQQRAFTLVHLKTPPHPAQDAMLLECGTRWCVYFNGMDFVAVAPEQIERLQGCLRIEALSAGGLGCNHKALPAGR